MALCCEKRDKLTKNNPDENASDYTNNYYSQFIVTQNNNTNIVLAKNGDIRDKRLSDPNSPFLPKSSSSSGFRNRPQVDKNGKRSSYLISNPTPVRKS